MLSPQACLADVWPPDDVVRYPLGDEATGLDDDDPVARVPQMCRKEE
jgi:hypothetical protein